VKAAPVKTKTTKSKKHKKVAGYSNYQTLQSHAHQQQQQQHYQQQLLHYYQQLQHQHNQQQLLQPHQQQQQQQQKPETSNSHNSNSNNNDNQFKHAADHNSFSNFDNGQSKPKPSYEDEDYQFNSLNNVKLPVYNSNGNGHNSNGHHISNYNSNPKIKTWGIFSSDKPSNDLDEEYENPKYAAFNAKHIIKNLGYDAFKSGNKQHDSDESNVKDFTLHALKLLEYNKHKNYDWIDHEHTASNEIDEISEYDHRRFDYVE